MAEQCCGCGKTYQLNQPNLAPEQLARIEAIRREDARAGERAEARKRVVQAEAEAAKAEEEELEHQRKTIKKRDSLENQAALVAQRRAHQQRREVRAHSHLPAFALTTHTE